MNTACLGAFSGTITAVTNSTAKITFSVTSGALPTGTSLSSSGKVAAISGTITEVGTFTFVIRATLATGEYAAAQYVVYVAAIANDELDDGTVGDAYSNTLTIEGPASGASTWSVINGSLPAGLSLNASTGEISGTPTIEAGYSFTIQFTNSLMTCSKVFGINIDQSTFCGYISGNFPPDGVVDEFYSYGLIYTGPAAPISVGVSGWELVSGSFPAGLSLANVGPDNPRIVGFINSGSEGVHDFSLSFTNDLGTCTIPLSITAFGVGSVGNTEQSWSACSLPYVGFGGLVTIPANSYFGSTQAEADASALNAAKNQVNATYCCYDPSGTGTIQIADAVWELLASTTASGGHASGFASTPDYGQPGVGGDFYITNPGEPYEITLTLASSQSNLVGFVADAFIGTDSGRVVVSTSGTIHRTIGHCETFRIGFSAGGAALGGGGSVSASIDVTPASPP